MPYDARAMRQSRQAGGVVLTADGLAHDTAWQMMAHAEPSDFQHALEWIHPPPVLFEPDVTNADDAIELAMVLARLRDSRLVIPKAHVQLKPAPCL